MVIDDRFILDRYGMTDEQRDKLITMQQEYDSQYPGNTITLKAVNVCGYVCIAEFNDFQEMKSSIVTPISSDGKTYNRQAIRLDFVFETNCCD